MIFNTMEDILASKNKYGCIYADPPWTYSNKSTRGAQASHYSGMTVDEICDLPVKDICLDDAHLHMWTTNAFLFESKRVMESWGFEYRSTFVWCKTQMGIGNYWRCSHEILLTAIRGDAKRFNDKSLKSWAEFPRTKHSKKPLEIQNMVMKASHGPYLEMFARQTTDGWDSFGNEIEVPVWER